MIGSEASNGVNDVTIQHVYLSRPSYGFRIKSARDRGGEIYNITVRDMVMDGGGIMVPLNFNDSYNGYIPPQPLPPTAPPTPNIHDIVLESVTATGSGQKSVIVGLPEACIRRVMLSNVTIAASTNDYGFELQHMTGTFTNVTGTPDLPFIVDENVMVTESGSTPTIPPPKPLQPGEVACNQQTWFP